MYFYTGLLVLLAGLQASAHNMDLPGPHKGYIQMPAAFHVEVVPMKKNRFKVYLLDAGLENPTIKKSTVEMWFKENDKEIQFKCTSKEDTYFLCASATDLPMKGQLVVKAKREGAQGNDATYDLPWPTHKKKK